MAEPIEPENEPETEPTDQDENAEDAEGGPADPDVLTGFSAEQRRFLWTITGLNVVAVLLGAAIVVGYLASARSQDVAIVKLADQYKAADDNLQKAEQRDIPRIVAAEMAGDKDASNELREEVVEAYQSKSSAYANWRRARGLDATELTNDQLLGFAADLNHLIAQDVAGARASTQPASRPATEPATKP